ncbi:MAG: hypothetical protein M3248_03440, partial [Actinomycetota bacterium]|nr:hypothetical protein [Actinomycetota bacterium]
MNNTGEEKQKARARSVIMGHGTHTSTPMLDKKVNLAPGEEQEFTAPTITAQPTISTRLSGASRRTSP